MVLYESHSVIHGRPFPLKGRFFANLFVHFEPIGHSVRHNHKHEGAERDVDQKYRDSLMRGSGGHENEQSGLPSYILAGTPEEDHWLQTHPNGVKSKRKSSVTGSTVAHLAAQGGDLDTLKTEVEKKKDLVHKRDANGWLPVSNV
jgi:prolyl 4-hydroxylase